MTIKVWYPGISDTELTQLAYWERNTLALNYADGWYEDFAGNYPGWLRVLSLEKGQITFHIPDNFDVGNLPKIECNWDGHSTEDKWRKILAKKDIKA